MRKIVPVIAGLGVLLSSCGSNQENQPNVQGIGLLGGYNDSSKAYAFVSDAQGNLQELSFAPDSESFSIRSVAIDVDGNRGLIGGWGDTEHITLGPLYTVKLDGAPTIHQVQSTDQNDFFNSVAINENGTIGLAGGFNNLSPIVYAVDIDTFKASKIEFREAQNGEGISGMINTTAINKPGNIGVIGGIKDSGEIIASIVKGIQSTSPTINPISLGSPIPGNVLSVAISAESTPAMLFGGVTSDSQGFAFMVDEAENAYSIELKNPDSGGIGSVAMNRKGSVAILGGQSMPPSEPPLEYPRACAYKLNMTHPNPNLSATPITTDSEPFPEGAFLSVAIDSAGVRGLMGGVNQELISSENEKPIAYTVDIATGKATPISFVTSNKTPLTNNGSILSVEIQDQGEAGLLGGIIGNSFDNPIPAAFLVTGLSSDTPIATQLNLPGATAYGAINSVSFDHLVESLNAIQTGTLSDNNLVLANYLNKNGNVAHFLFPATIEGKLTPALESASPLRNIATLFSADNTFFSIAQGISRRGRDARQFRRLEEKEQKELAMLAKRGEDCYKITNYPKEIRLKNLWVEATGLVAHQDKQNQTPGFDPWSIGALLGYDMQKTKNFRAGLGLAYAYTYVDFEKGNGNSNINQEYLSLYGLWNRHNAYANLGIWFGLFQTNNERKIPLPSFDFRATSFTSGYQFDPHVEIGYDYDFKDGICTFEPFGAVDWIHNWQFPYKEYSSSPFKYVQQRLHSSMLRVEAGFRIYEEFEFRAWNLVLQQNISYLYKDTYSLGSWKGFLLGAPGTLILDTFTEAEHLGSFTFSMIFDPKKPCYPTGRLGYTGEFGAEYRSHQITASTEWSF